MTPLLAVAVALLGGALASSPAWGQCGGICIYEAASPQMGSSYAGGPATAEDAATAFLNPAGMTRLEEAEILQGAYAAFFDLSFDADRSDTSDPPAGFGNSGGNAGGFLPGAGLYAVLPIADELGFAKDLRFGMAINGIFGGSVEYNRDWVGRNFITDAKLLILNLNPSVGLRLTDWLSVGVGLNVFYAELSKFRLNPDPPFPPGKLKADGADDWGVTFSAGLLFEPREGTRIGINYRGESDLTLTGGDASGFRYGFDLPQGFNVGLHQQFTPKLALLFDAGWSDWSQFSQQSITVGSAPEGNLSFDRGWRDTWRVGTGFQYQLDERWRLQGGFSYDSSPMKDSRRQPDLPASEQYRFSTGLQYELRDTMTVGATYTFLWFGNPDVNTVTLPGPPATAATLDGEYDPAWGQFFGFTFTWRFCSPIPWASCPSKPQPSG